MAGEEIGKRSPARSSAGSNGSRRSIEVSLVLTGEQAAAVEGWRVANQIDSHPEAVKELVRIGLLSEIGRIYRMIAGSRDGDEAFADGSESRG